MTLPPLRIHAPDSEQAAVDLLAALGPSARPYAGGTGLLLTDDHRGLSDLVDVKRIPRLGTVERRGEDLRIGAAVSLWALERSALLRCVLPELPALLGAIANPRVLAAGTLAGNLCLAAPRTDLTALLGALDASVLCVGPDGERKLAVLDLPAATGQTALVPAEILTTVVIPIPRPPSGLAWQRFTPLGWPTASVTVLLEATQGRVARAAVCVGAAVPRPARRPEVEAALIGAPLSELAERVGSTVAIGRMELELTSDGHGSAEYKRHLLGVLCERALGEAAVNLAGRAAQPRSGREPSHPPEAAALPSAPKLGSSASGHANQFRLESEVNGRAVSLSVDSRELLLDVLRAQLGLTAAKRSCAAQECGACTVLLDGLPVSACSTLAWEACGRTVLTAEGLSGPEGLHPLQRAFIENSSVQCGYCTPGMLMSAYSLLSELDRPSPPEIRHFLRGTLCRCTGYRSIVDAIGRAATAARGDAVPVAASREHSGG